MEYEFDCRVSVVHFLLVYPVLKANTCWFMSSSNSRCHGMRHPVACRTTIKYQI